MTLQDLQAAHSASFKNHTSIEASKRVGCFSCGEIYPASEIDEYWDHGETAVCARCGVDAVVGDAAVGLITEDWLTAMHGYWFEFGS